MGQFVPRKNSVIIVVREKVILSSLLPLIFFLIVNHYTADLYWTKQVSMKEAQLSQRDRAAACLNYGKNISAKSVHLGYFLKSSGNSVEPRTL